MRLGQQARRGGSVFFMTCNQGVTFQVWRSQIRYYGVTLWFQPRVRLRRIGRWAR